MDESKNVDKTATKRLVSYDIIRALCIILVVMAHFMPAGMPGWYEGLLKVLHSFGMPLFMFISGYIYIYVERQRTAANYLKHVRQKFIRLMIPYYFVSLIVFALNMLYQRGMYLENPLLILSFYKIFYVPTGLGYYLWFAFTLFMMFLIIPLFNTSKKLNIITIIALVLYFIPYELPGVFCLKELQMYFIYFCLGCLVYDKVILRNFMTKINCLIALCVFVGMYLLKINVSIYAVDFVTALSGIVLIMSCLKYFEKLSERITKSLLLVAACTYTIYLFHVPFMGIPQDVFNVILRIDVTQNNLIFIGAGLIITLIGVIGPILLHLFVVRYSKVFSFLIGTKFIGKKKKNNT